MGAPCAACAPRHGRDCCPPPRPDLPCPHLAGALWRPECLQDLQRFLLRDSPETRAVLRQLAAWNVVSRDIVPIVVLAAGQHELLVAAVKV